LRKAKITAGSVVLLSDGADTGSSLRLAQLERQALAAHVRVFTVGLRSPQFQAPTLRHLATATAANYAEAEAPQELTPIHRALPQELGNEYLVEYRSSVPAAASVVQVQARVSGLPGAATASYRTPAIVPAPPYHRSWLDRFFLSDSSAAFVALVAGGLIMF